MPTNEPTLLDIEKATHAIASRISGRIVAEIANRDKKITELEQRHADLVETVKGLGEMAKQANIPTQAEIITHGLVRIESLPHIGSLINAVIAAAEGVTK